MPNDKSHGDTRTFKPGDIISNSRGTQVTIQWSRHTLEALFANPAISDWIKGALPLPDRRMGATHAAERGDLARRDPLDALHDVDLLQALMQDRLEACLRAASAGEPQDGCSR